MQLIHVGKAIKAVLLYDKGYSDAKIAEILLIDDETVSRHIHAQYAIKKLKFQNGGSHSHLNPEENMEEHLESRIFLYVKDICAHVRTQYAKRIPHEPHDTMS